jgi:hypothetical protein
MKLSNTYVRVYEYYYTPYNVVDKSAQQKWDWQAFYHHGSAAPLAQASGILRLALQGGGRPLFSHLILIASSVKHSVTLPSKGASEGPLSRSGDY